MYMKIETWDKNKILRTISKDINKNEIKKYSIIWKKMLKQMKKQSDENNNETLGIAAPQVWINKRLIVIKQLTNVSDKWKIISFKNYIMINPKIITKSKETNIQEEGCLSLPNKEWKVERSIEIKTEFIDEKGKLQIIYSKWLNARIILHEIDHLNWILFTDY